MTVEYHYQDLASGQVVRSAVPLQSNGVTLLATVKKEDLTPEDARALELLKLPMLIGKQQKTASTNDPWQMWRYYNNAQVAREVLAGAADAEVLAAFENMLTENKLSDPDYYGAMTTQTFAEWLIGLNREFKLLGLRLESGRIRQRRELNAPQF